MKMKPLFLWVFIVWCSNIRSVVGRRSAHANLIEEYLNKESFNQRYSNDVIEDAMLDAVSFKINCTQPLLT
jgi:hypothetical protein